MAIHIELDDDDGTIETVKLPSKRIVCLRCDGRGVHDCWEGGMTGDEMAEQGPEFFEDYRSGVYDTRCTECNGRNVVEIVDREACGSDPALMRLLVRYDRQQQELADMYAMEAMERRMGC
jgi:hypothetical protein